MEHITENIRSAIFFANKLAMVTRDLTLFF